MSKIEVFETRRQLILYLIGWDNLRLWPWTRWLIFWRRRKIALAREAHFRRFGTYAPVPGPGVG